MAAAKSVARDDTYALMEILHVVRDNFTQDLREAAPHFFSDLPMVQLLSYYPATFPAGENDYRIPAAPLGHLGARCRPAGFAPRGAFPRRRTEHGGLR